MNRDTHAHVARHLVALAVLALVVAAPLAALTAPVATAAPANSTDATPTQTAAPTATPTPDAGGASSDDRSGGEFERSELERGGTQPSAAPDSVRYLDDTGAVAVRYTPVAPLNNESQYLGAGATIHTDDIELYSTRFGENLDPATITVRVVFWQPETRQIETSDGVRTEEYAANQSTHAYSAELAAGYDTAGIDLPSHFDEAFEATMWLEQDGEPIEGARWRFTHQSSEAAQGIAIDSRGDQWLWAGKNIFSIAIPGLLVSAVGARGIIRRTGRGPEKGAVWWGVVVAALTFGVVAVGYFYTAQLFARIPQLFGVGIALIAFVVMLETMGPKTRTDEFVRDELGDANAPLGDGLKNNLYRDKARVRTVRREDGVGLIKPGIRPFLARLFAAPAVLEKSALKTEIDIRRGPDDRTFVADPDAEHPLTWTPAHWAFEPRLLAPAREDAGVVAGLLERINGRLVAGTAVGAVVGAAAFQYTFNATSAGAVVGATAAFLALAIRAKDGHADFEPAPVHYREARASLAALQVAFSDAKSLREAWQVSWRERARTAQEAKDLDRDRDETISRLMQREELGVDPGTPGSLVVDPSDVDADGAPSEDGDGGFRFDGDADSNGQTDGGDDE